MNKTSIEWVKNPDGSQGYTWNPLTGCLNHINGMCKGGNFPCYAYKLANGRLKSRYLANEEYAPVNVYDLEMIDPADDPFYPRFWEDRLQELVPSLDKNNKLILGNPKGIFVCDMSDLFGIGISPEWTNKVMSVIKLNPQHRFYLLTKQPQNLIKFSPFPENCWCGVTTTNKQQYIGAQRELDLIKARVKFISCEPLLEHLPVSPYDFTPFGGSINWVIIGAQTKPYKPPEISWVQEIALACTKAHIPLFLKDNLKSLLPNRMPFWAVYNWKELDKGALITMSENKFRQEMPTTNV